MTLRIGNKKVCPTKLVLPNTQNITITQNGTYTPDTGYTGFSTVEVDVAGGGGSSVTGYVDITETNYNALSNPSDSTLYNITTDPYKNFTTTTSNVTNDNGVLSNFSLSDYAIAPILFRPESTDNWEMGIKVTMASSPSGTQTIFEQAASQYKGFRLCRSNSDANWFFQVTNTSNAEAIVEGTTILQPSTTYYFKITFNASNTLYTAYLSTDGETYTAEGTLTHGQMVKATTLLYIGRAVLPADSARVWGGSIDMNNFYIKINGVEVYRGYQTSPSRYAIGSNIIQPA